jgi:hypothetical protein
MEPRGCNRWQQWQINSGRKTPESSQKLTTRGNLAIRVIREAVAEIEASSAEQLGTKRFAQFRQLLLDVSRLS